jgi:16S rRNA (cytosine1402-N4)-methyltransferase
MSEFDGAHETVLLREAVTELVQNPSGTYVDATFGRGGHSRAILEVLNEHGRLIAIDKDLDALAKADKFYADEFRFEIVHGSFADIDKHLGAKGIRHVDGILADLGVSSPQLDDAERGFSFLKDGPLDMRMNQQEGLSASQWLAGASVEEITRVLREYGEEKFAGRIARAIYEACRIAPIETTLALAKVVSEANPSWEKHKHPATRTFQAIRIKVNSELKDLEVLLQRGSEALSVGGRMVVISFHSLEDRIVKQFMRAKTRGNAPPPDVPVFEKDIVRHFKIIGKAIKPSDKEVSNNIRARSAVMRILEKISHE